MELTIHGRKRILGRTKMLTKDVLALLTNGAFVSLGVVDGREYLLFYSPPDKECRIAVVSADHARLISIWGLGYHLPEGVRKASKRDQRCARDALREYLFRTMEAHFSPEIFLNAKIEVQVNAKPVYEYEAGTVPLSVSERRSETFQHLEPCLRELTTAVESLRDQIEGAKVHYAVYLRNPRAPQAIRYYTLPHTHAVERFRAAPS